MKISRRTARVVLTICLLMLQAQLLAASALGCRHTVDPSSAGDAPAGCPLHRAAQFSTDEQSPEPLLTCHKCVLHCAVSVSVPASAPMLLLSLQESTVTRFPIGDSFANHISSPDLRPPISLLL